MPERCSHGHHDGMCGYQTIRTFRDDVGYGGVPPTGLERDVLEDTCRCEGDHD